MRRKKKRVEETGSEAQHSPQAVGFHFQDNIQPSCFTDYIFKCFELICQGTFFREGNEIYLVPFEVSLLKRGEDLLIQLNRFGARGYIARLHRTKQKGIYRFYYKDATFEIDFSNEITVVINKLNNILTVFNLLPVERDKVFRYLEKYREV
jgi:hypothetical protein